MLKFNGGRELMNEFHFCKVSTFETAKPHNLYLIVYHQVMHMHRSLNGTYIEGN